MAAVISSVMTTKDKVPFFVNRCEEMGIEVLPPDVNSSDHGFVVSGKSIRFGLDAVKNVGHSAVETILGRGRTALRVDLGLLRAGRRARRQQARDRVPDQVRGARLDRQPRKGMLEALPAAQAAGQKAQEDAQLGQGSIFDLGDGRGDGAPRRGPARPPISAAEFDQRELLGMEKETLGTYVSAHPLSEVRDALRARVDCPLAELASAGRRLGHGRGDRHRVQEDPHQERHRR